MKQRSWMIFQAGLLVLPTLVMATDDREVYLDPVGDAVIRRTDAGHDGPVNNAARLPDLVAIAIGGWRTSTPRNDPYNGSWIDARDTDLFRVDVVFSQLVNPPGPINLVGDGYDPFRYGNQPVYGYVEFDLDGDSDTGGEIDGVENRPLGNVSRFGSRFSGSEGSEAAVSNFDFDDDLCTLPLVERSGEEFHLSLCRCQSFTVDPQNDSTPNSFDAGDTWFLHGRLFRRTHAFKNNSFAFGGSEPGMYDPLVTLRFQHDIASDLTTVSIIWALDNSGWNRLTGNSGGGNDFDVSNATSILEAVNGMRVEAMNGSGGRCSDFALLEEWGDDNHDRLSDYLRADQWDVKAIFGTAYDVEQFDASYVWTDVGPDANFGDCNGDRFANEADQGIIATVIASADGTSSDADGLVNGQVSLPVSIDSFALYDLDYDGRINMNDSRLIGPVRRGDLNGDLQVDNADRVLLGTMIGLTSGDLGFNPTGDLDGNGIIDSQDDWRLRRIILLETRRAEP